MKRKERLDLLTELGQYLLEEPDEALQFAIQRSYLDNRWFTEENTRQSLQAIATNFLSREKLERWLTAYDLPDHAHPEKTIGLIMAGNIPLVGFQDWLAVFVSGQRAKVKLSEKDKHLLPFLVKLLGDWAFESWEYTEFVDDSATLQPFDAVIATGSNNTARYFEAYFGKYENLIRRNRNSIAVLSGEESSTDLYALGRDVFSYFGLGCRNVSKLYVPTRYDFEPLLEALHNYREIVQHDKYKNNFDYNLTLFILNKIPYQNNGCLLLREEKTLQARIASVNYEFYDTPEQLASQIAQISDEIQCAVGNLKFPGVELLPFGKSQEPELWDYPDGVDVMQFLQKISG